MDAALIAASTAIGVVAKKLDEQSAAQKAAVDAALIASQTAISVALATQERTVGAAFAAKRKSNC